MQTHISPIGYDSTRVTRPLLSHGLDSGDQILLLRPDTEQDDRRADEAVTDVERMLGQLEPSISVERCTVHHEDFQTATLDCIEVIDEADGDVIANFGGGARDVFLPFSIAVLSRIESITTVTRYSDIDGSVSEVTFPNLTAQVPETGREILAALSELDGAGTVPELTKATDRSKSTITRHVNKLEACRAVETEMHGKTKYVELTFTGILLLRTEA
jgi:CRISPR-associated protein Csa3